MSALARRPRRTLDSSAHARSSVPELRPYQLDVIAELEQVLAFGKRRVLLVAPTGSGKTVIFAEIIKRAVARHQRVLVLAHRREIVRQTAAKLHAHGVRHGIIMATMDDALRPQEPVQVSAVATLWVRAVRSEKIKLPPADLIIIDEAHHTVARTYTKIIAAYPNAAVIGCTATPCRGDGRGLGGIFTALVEAPQVAPLIEQGYLVKSLCYAPVDPDLRGVRTQAGDYVESQLAERMDRPKLVGDIVTHWHKYSQRRRTIAFACSVAHSIHIRDEFLKSGVRAEHLDGGTPTDERDAILARLASGKTEVVANCMVLTEGFDCPDVGCIVLARPTKKMGLFRQMIGRGLRPADAKTDCIIVDHSGAVLRHGLPEDHVEWALDPDRHAEAPAHQARLERKVASLIECTECGALRLGGKPCPNCGFLPHRPAQYVAHLEGELGLVNGGRASAVTYDQATRRQWHAMLTAIANERGYQRGWIAHKYQGKFGIWPAWGLTSEPISPSPEVRSWVRSQDIRYAKSRNRGAA
jgi:superfamily II DNA or RNA helicase